jgi:hypothetical protein
MTKTANFFVRALCSSGVMLIKRADVVPAENQERFRLNGRQIINRRSKITKQSTIRDRKISN